jgi:hypothetical protein
MLSTYEMSIELRESKKETLSKADQITTRIETFEQMTNSDTHY